MININWSRWIYASVIEHFISAPYFAIWDDYLENRTAYDAQGIIPVYVDGLDFNVDDVKDYIEVRIDGPHFAEVSKNNYRGTLLINVILCITKDENFHKLYTLAGKIQNTFSTIPVYAYGNEDNDNNGHFGCLSLERLQPIKTDWFGQPEDDIKHTYITIEGHYTTTLRGE